MPSELPGMAYLIAAFIASSLLTTLVQIWLQQRREKTQQQIREKSEEKFNAATKAAAEILTNAAQVTATRVEGVRTDLVQSGTKVLEKLEEIHVLTNSTLSEARNTIAELRRYTANLERLLMQATTGEQSPIGNPERPEQADPHIKTKP